MRLEVLNLRYLLWRSEGAEWQSWAGRLAELTGYETCRVEDLLRGSEPHQEEREQLARTFRVSVEDLETANMIEEAQEDVLGHNLFRLIESLEHGDKSKLADELGVHPTSISGWRSGRQSPNRNNLEKLRRYFGLPDTSDLSTEPLFLSPYPVGRAEQKRWVSERLDNLDADILRDLFPALERVMREP